MQYKVEHVIKENFFKIKFQSLKQEAKYLKKVVSNKTKNQICVERKEELWKKKGTNYMYKKQAIIKTHQADAESI